MTENNIVAVSSGYQVSSRNATKHGILSRYTVMQWENSADYDALLQSLTCERQPEGATEEHLVEELAGIIWRKMRLRYAEMTSIQEALNKHIQAGDSSARAALLAGGTSLKDFDIKKTVTTSEKATNAELRQMKQIMSCWKKAEAILGDSASYDDALAALHKEDRQEREVEYLGERVNDYSTHVYKKTADSLQYWVMINISSCEKAIYELESREKVKNHLLGQVFLSMDSMTKYTRYETHLDKKFEKTLGILYKLQGIRGKSFIRPDGDGTV